MMETAAAAMLEAGVGRFRGPSMAALLAEMWAPLAVALAALATLPSLLRRLQVLILRLRSRGKEVISSHISTYYSSGDDSDSDGSDEEDDDDEEEEGSSSGGEEGRHGRIGYYEGAADDDDDDDGCFPWGGTVVRTWQGLPRRISGGARLLAPGSSSSAAAAVRLWGSITASGDAAEGGEAWWDADEGGRAPAAEAPVVVGWRRDHAVRPRRRRVGLLAAVATSTK
ncbi:hypothetical protein E2562_027835 [Oryza meyeriana var. granulata]|uniref:Uncharacterized protein n=1 Tax=Oryza meyeriana var. granulata TaxID=110450 RepID=A0A6G1DN64_9ORYZ|nr:hypothetical protein E2562_027835 [Oryza meyeriana var. granulata]